MRGVIGATLLVLGLWGLSGCAQTPPTAPSVFERLPDSVQPTGYKLDLTIDPRQERFSGVAEIKLAVSAPASQMVLHGQDLNVTNAELRLADGSAIKAVFNPMEGRDGWARVQFERQVNVGMATLTIHYTAPFATEGAGIYRSAAEGRHYAASQMEPLDARRALPCFDEPRFKVPFNVSVTAPATDKVFFNTRETEAVPAESGMVRHQFAPTLPLPTYLLAFAVGPYDTVEALPLPSNSLRNQPVPLRGIATAGKGPQLAYALANTRALVEHLESYFGVAYPYDKLDLLAAPGYGLGAMENAGLVVYSESVLLMQPNAGVRQRRNFAAIHAHELAHMWFGDYVTPAWWDDLWLNEAFATWMGNKAAAAVFPDLGLERATQTEALRAMASDSLSAARQIRQPIASTADIYNAFDDITYSKGGAVLAMIESYVGTERFRDGVRRHMQRFPHGVASTDDFFASLGEGARAPEAVEALRSFTDQPNVPLLSASLECRNGSPVARLSQSTYRPLGSSLPDRRWRVPACVAVYGTGGPSRACTLLSDADAEIPLPAAAGCTSTFLPNADSAGYYRFNLNEAGWQVLLEKFEQLTPAEQIASIDSLAASHRAGKTPAAQVLNGIAKAGASTDLDVVISGVDLALSLESLVPKERRVPLEMFLTRIFGPRLAALKASSPPQQALARTRLTSLLALFAADRSVRAQLHAAGRAEVGLASGTRPEPDLRRASIGVLAEEGGRPEFDAALARARASNEELYRTDVVAGLSRAQTPETRTALWDAVMDKPFGNAEIISALGATLGRPDTAEQAWAELEPRLASMSQRLPPFIRSAVPQVASALCSQAAADRVRAYFTANAAAFPGHERTLAQTLERIAHCAALRAWDNGALAATAVERAK